MDPARSAATARGTERLTHGDHSARQTRYALATPNVIDHGRATLVPMAVVFERVAPVLPVRSVAAALARYQRLGFQGDAYLEANASTQADPIYGFVKWGSVEIHLTRTPELDPKTNTSVCYLYVDDADALYAQWSAAGVDGQAATALGYSVRPAGVRIRGPRWELAARRLSVEERPRVTSGGAHVARWLFSMAARGAHIQVPLGHRQTIVRPTPRPSSPEPRLSRTRTTPL
jgi:hypothetical protein